MSSTKSNIVINNLIEDFKLFYPKVFSSIKQGLSSDWLKDKIRYSELAIFLSIFVLVAITYLSFFSPTLFYDDWHQFVTDVVKDSAWFNTHAVRPYGLVIQKLIYTIFGPSIQAFYAMNIVVLAVNAYLFYKILSFIFPDNRRVMFAIAVLSLIYPADSSRTFAHMVAIRICSLLGLLSIIALIQYLKHGKWKWVIIAAVLSTFPATFIYEGFWGLSAALSLIVLIPFLKNREMKQRFVSIFFYFLSTNLVIVLWRWVYPRIMGIQDVRNEMLSLDLPIRILNNLLTGYKILPKTWVDNIKPLLTNQSTYWKYPPELLEPANVTSWLIAASIFAVFFIVSFILLGSHTVGGIPPIKSRNLIRTLWIIAVGFVLTTAGYIPITFIYPPNMYSFMSRVNYLAVWGSSVITIGIFWFISQLFFNKPKWSNLLFLILVLSVIIPSSVTELRNQQKAKHIWEKQVILWQEIVKTVPGLKNNAKVLLVGDHLVNYTENYAYLLNDVNVFDNEPRVQVLYNNIKFEASAIAIDKSVIKWTFTPEGLEYSYLGNTFYPYDELLVLRYEQDKDDLYVVRVIENLEEELSLDFSPVGYDPHEHIEYNPDKEQTKHRYLIGIRE